jgi:ABC-2 type transport system permease protein/sodium transport system permease protein
MASTHPPGWARLARLTRKELSEILRDRRTIVTLVAMPLLLYPLLSVAFLQFAWIGKADSERGATYLCGFTREEDARLFFKRMEQGAEVLRRRQGAKDGPVPPLLEPLIGTEEELLAALRAGKIDLVIEIPKAGLVVTEDQPLALHGQDWRFDCKLTYLAGAPGGQGALALIERRLAAADAADLSRRLNLPDVKEHTFVLRPLLVAVKGEEGDSFASLASLVPLILILMTVTGAVYPAIDLTAGERERGTLEILVAAPVPRFQLLTAKYLAVVTVAVLTAVVNLVSMTITLQVSGLARQMLPGGLSALLIVELFALLLLFAAFFSAVLLSLTSFARSFKEAQAYLIPLMLGSLGPGVLAMMPGLRLRPELAVLPLVNIVLLARDLFQGTADPLLAGLVVVTTLLYALAALGLAARVFGAESVLYSEQSGWADLLRRPDEPSAAPSIASALWCLALAVPIHFLVQGLLPRPVDESGNVIAGLLIVQLLVAAGLSVVLFLLLPAASAYIGRVRWASGFGLAVPRPAALVAGLVLGVSLWPLVLQFLQQGASLESRHEPLLEAMRQAREAAWPLFLATTIIAAVTEELFFRGYLFAALRARAGAAVTIGVTAVLFGVTHVFLGGALGLDRLLPSTLLGLVLGLVCWLSASVVPGMVLHLCHNTALVLLLETGWSDREGVPALWVAAGAVGALAGFAILVLAGRRSVSPKR